MGPTFSEMASLLPVGGKKKQNALGFQDESNKDLFLLCYRGVFGVLVP